MMNVNTHNVQTNLKNSTEFSISINSAKIFSMLSTSLSREKERYVITELCNNAIDAHTVAGKSETPIHVNLPTSLQKEFRVRDYGPGLSEADVYKFLTTYGESNKGNVSNMLGHFGIGSKSPASVSDTWTINSHHDGYVISYLVHINANGIPSINKLYQKITTETGVEVIVPVKDTRLWIDAAKKSFEFYDVMPVIKGMSEKITQPKYDYSYKNLLKGYSSNHCVKVLMNRRAYDVDLSKTGNELYQTGTKYIPFDIGSLSVSLSREDLQYDSRTIESIKVKIDQINLEIQKEWNTEVSPHTDIFEYQQAAYKFKQDHYLSSKGCRFFATNDPLMLNVDFDNLQHFHVKFTFQESLVQLVTSTHCKIISYKTRYSNNINNVSLSNGAYGTTHKILSFSSKSKDDITFIRRDTKSTPSRCKNAIFNNKFKIGIILDKEYFDIIPNCFTKILASSLDKAPVKSREGRNVVNEKTYIYVRNGNHLTKLASTDFDSNKTYIFIRFKNASTISSVTGPFDNKFLGIFDTDNVIFIKEGITPPKNSISAKEYVDLTYTQYSAKKNCIIDSINKYHLSSYYSLSQIGGKLLNHQTFTPGSIAFNLTKEVFRVKNIPDSLTCGSDLVILNKCEKMFNEDITKVPSGGFLNKFITAYPMLEFVVSRYSDAKLFKNVIDYINQCGI